MKNIILIGFMGSGKTSVGKRLCQLEMLPFLDSDEEIERQQQMKISELFQLHGEEYFRGLETEFLRSKKDDTVDCVLSVGGGLPICPENRALLKEIGLIVYLKATKETITKRLMSDKTRPLLQGGNLDERVQELLAARSHIYEELADIIVETDNRTIDDICEEIIRKKAN